MSRARVAALSLTLGLAALAPAGAQVRRVEDLRYPPLPAFEIPRPERVVLDNGLVVMLLEDHELPLVGATALVRAGAVLEPAEKVGTAQLTGEVLRTGGAGARSADELDDFLEGKAAVIESSIGTDSARATMSCLAQDFAPVLAAFADVLRRPLLPEDRLALAKTRLNATISRQNDNPLGILFREFDEIVYGEASPYARRPTYASVAAITRDDLAAWHREHFHPNRTILGLAGDFDRAQALALVRQAFGDWPPGPQAPDRPAEMPAPPPPGVQVAEKAEVTQSSVAMGTLGIRRDSPDYFAVELMNQVLGSSWSSRLFSNVRSTKGLAYAVGGEVGGAFDHPGRTLVWLSTKTETTAAGIEALLEEVRNMVARPPTEEELAKARSGILNSFVFNSDSRRKILNQQLTFEYFGYPLDWLDRYRAGIEAVTAAEVLAAAGRYLKPQEFAILVVGPAKGRDRDLSEFGKVTPRDITIPQPPGGS
jgi:zinc protease